MSIQGVCPVISSSFHADGSLDLPSFERMGEYLLNCKSIMIFGIATENAKLFDYEREEMLSALARVCAGTTTRIVATVADHGTDVAISRAQKWVSLGADEINVLPSSFLNPPLEFRIDHIERIIQSVDVPVIVQHLPQAGESLDPKSLTEIGLRNDNFGQVKVEEIPSRPVIELITQYSDKKITCLVGWGGLEWLTAIADGAVGVQPGCSLIEIYLHAQAALDDGDYELFRNRFEPIVPALELWMRHPEALIAIEKYILQKRGIVASQTCRTPSFRLSDADYIWADSIMDTYSLGASR